MANSGREIAPSGIPGTWISVNVPPDLRRIDATMLAQLLVSEGALSAQGRIDDPHVLDALWPEGKAGSPQDIIDSVAGWSEFQIVQRSCQRASATGRQS